jgi:hypothetical protein
VALGFIWGLKKGAGTPWGKTLLKVWEEKGWLWAGNPKAEILNLNLAFQLQVPLGQIKG